MLPADPVEWKPSSLTNCLTRIIDRIGLCAPLKGNYTSYSLGIGDHTEQVLLGVPMEAPMAKFGWASRSDEKARL